MNRKTIIVTVLLAVISLVIIIAGQVFWVRKAYNLQEKQFNERVFQALSNVVETVQVLNKDSVAPDPVSRVLDNYFVAYVNDTPQPYLLENLIKSEFEKSDLIEDFEYGIYDCFSDSIVYGSKVSFEPGARSEPAKLIHELPKMQLDGHYFSVLFPNKTRFIIKQLDFWMYSSIVILLIIIFFSYTVFVMLRQKKLSDIRTDFVNNMTHELKTPISTIGLSAEALSSPNIADDPARMRQYVDIIKSENGRLKNLVERVLQTASLTPKKVTLKNEIIDLHEVLQKAISTFELRAQERDGEVKSDLKAASCVVKGDLIHITNVIYNLLDNAIKYSEEEPHIEVTTHNEDNKLVLRVRDNGVGISRHHQRQIFDKFYRIPTGNLHSVRGYGLGLFYVKTIMKAHRATIHVESQPGKGSTFILKFKTVKPIIKSNDA
jgi:two-component system phosphate regulon sensor histidine kinase PhoR